MPCAYDSAASWTSGQRTRSPSSTTVATRKSTCIYYLRGTVAEPPARAYAGFQAPYTGSLARRASRNIRWCSKYNEKPLQALLELTLIRSEMLFEPEMSSRRCCIGANHVTSDDGMLLLYIADHDTPKPEAKQRHHRLLRQCDRSKSLAHSAQRITHITPCSSLSLRQSTKAWGRRSVSSVCNHEVSLFRRIPRRHVWEGSRMVTALCVCTCYIYSQEPSSTQKIQRLAAGMSLS